MRFAVSPGEPRTLAEFARWISRLVPFQQALRRHPDSFTCRRHGIGDADLAAADAAALLAGNPSRGSGAREVGARLLAEELIPFDRPLAGSIRLDFEVERPRS